MSVINHTQLIATNRSEFTTPHIRHVKSLFEEHVDPVTLEGYSLPIPNDAKVVVGMSGGADSTVLGLFAAAYLAPRYPNIEFVFTDTKAEPESCYETLANVEDMTGVKIKRLQPTKGLFELIDQYNGFLPNSKARWCTRELKVAPVIQHMKNHASVQKVINLAGIRFDESNRDGISFQYSMDNGTAAFPFVDLGITRHMVFDILNRSVGIPSTYIYRSRSGCYSCFFQRNQEIIGMLFNHPSHFAETESYEKLSSNDEQRWTTPETLSKLGIRGYYPVPAFVDVRKAEVAHTQAPAEPKAKRDQATLDLFSAHVPPSIADSLYCAFALYVDERLGFYGGRDFTPGVYWQEFVTISTSLSGLKSALSKYYRFKMTTPMPHCDGKDMKIVIAKIEFPAGTIDTGKPSEDSFTWKSGTSFKQLRHLVLNCQSALEAHDLQRRYQDAIGIMRSSQSLGVAQDAAQEVINLRHQINAATPSGKVVWEGLFTPVASDTQAVQLQLDGVSVDTPVKKAREGIEFDEVPMACIQCSI